MCAISTESGGSFVDITPADVSVVCDPDPCAEALGNVIRVRVDGEFNLMTPLLGAFFGGQTIERLHLGSIRARIAFK